MNLELQYDNHRYYANDQSGKMIAEITYPAISDQVVDINHTFVDSSLRGQGVADFLMHAAVSDIKAKGLKIKTSCPYAEKWFLKHLEFAELLDK